MADWRSQPLTRILDTSHVHYAEKRPRYRANARRLPACQRSARLHHAPYCGRRDDGRTRSPLPRVHAEGTRHRARAAELPAARLPAVSESHLYLGQRRDLPRHPRRQDTEKRRRAEYYITVIKEGYFGDTSR